MSEAHAGTHDSMELVAQEAHGLKANPVYLFGIFAVLSVLVAAFIAVTIVFYVSSVSSIRAEKIETTNSYKQDYLVHRSGPLAELDSVGWIDSSENVVRIPIDTAMDIVAARD